METILYGIIMAAIRCFQCLPMGFAARLGRGIGAVAYCLDRRHRKRALSNLEKVYGDEWSEAERVAMAKENFRRVGENFSCAIKAASMTMEQLDPYVELTGSEAVEAVLKEDPGTNIIVAIGHFGNFELYARIGSLLSLERPATTYRALKGRVANRIMENLRKKSGIRYFERRKDVRALRQYMQEGGVVLGLLTDQHAGGGGVVAEFLGHPCSCSLAPGVLAHRYQARLFTAICCRTGLGRWRFEFGDEIPVRDAEGPLSVDAIAQEVQDVMSAAVRKDPANWFWAHRRWREGGRSFQRRAVRAGTADSTVPLSFTQSKQAEGSEGTDPK